jgi:hypothetical protein
MTARKKSPGPSKPGSRPKSPAEFAPGVFVGGWNDAVQFNGTRFCVLDEKPEDMPPGNHIPIYDEDSGGALRSNLDRLADEIGAARAKGRPVLVFCGHGIRRSPLAAAWYLHRSEHLPLDQAFERVQAVRPKAEPPSSWMGDPTSLEGE